jgi:hypothetical protein
MEYTFAPPNFCSKCGAPRDGQARAQQQSVNTATRKFEEVVEEEAVPILESLAYDVSYQGLGTKQLKFEDLAMQEPADRQPRKKGKRGRKKKINKEEILKQSVEACKSVGPNKSADVGGEK